MTKSWVQGEERFRQELQEGQQWAKLVAERLRSKGLYVNLTQSVWKPIGQRHEFKNEHDIEIICGNKKVLVESKSRRIKFGDDPSSYPYPTAFVDTVYGWEKKKDPVAAVILVSRSTEGMLVVPVSSKYSWKIKEAKDRSRGFVDRWYECPSIHLRTIDNFVEWVNKKLEMKYE